MYTTNCFVRIAHPIAFGALFIFTIIEMCIAVWMIPNTPKDDYSCFENCASNIEYWVCCLLGISGWTLVLGTVYSVRFLQNPYGYCTSAPSHALFLFSTWITWMAFAGSITTTMDGAAFCHAPTSFVYCSRLNALVGFAWLICAVLALMLPYVFIRWCKSSYRGDEFDGSLLDA